MCPEAFHKAVFSCFSLAGIARACHHADPAIADRFFGRKEILRKQPLPAKDPNIHGVV